MQAEKAEANANLTAYKTVPPNSWEPMGYNMTGTAPYFITHTLNWSNTRIMGNLGIGDGSVRTLNDTSNRDVNYTDNNFMAADISMAPWDPGRLTALNPLAGTTNATQAVVNETGNATNETVGNVTESSSINFNRPLSDPYHPILMGRPVDDLLYEYPLATPINMYARLLGLRMPGGSCLNMGVKCLGYGY
ncbi:hypothetical protein [Methanocella paludicola]|nr:hypothetical protein [Methanocella paludicola]